MLICTTQHKIIYYHIVTNDTTNIS